jgi:hypothetical protein
LNRQAADALECPDAEASGFGLRGDIAVAEWLSDRRTYSVMAILDALNPLMQPGSLTSKEAGVSVSAAEVQTFAPIPLVD